MLREPWPVRIRRRRLSAQSAIVVRGIGTCCVTKTCQQARPKQPQAGKRRGGKDGKCSMENRERSPDVDHNLRAHVEAATTRRAKLSNQRWRNKWLGLVSKNSQH